MGTLMHAQGKDTLFVHVDTSNYESARKTLSLFSELEQNLPHIQVYRMRDATLWQAASLGLTPKTVLQFLRENCIGSLPFAMQQLIVDNMTKWGKVILQRGAENRLVLRGRSPWINDALSFTDVTELALEATSDSAVFRDACRAEIKRRLIKRGYPVLDLVGYQAAPYVRVSLRPSVSMRPYQTDAIHRFFTSEQQQSGVIVLPCGSGKTLVGIGVIARLQLHTLIVAPNETSAQQWRRELLDKTTLDANEVAIYDTKEDIRPVTITTYSRVTAKTRSGELRHLMALTEHHWGLVIYDEVHMLPAPLFRLAADLQSARRLGLSATLVREDGRESEVYSLIGSKCYEMPWKQLEEQGFLAKVRCREIRIPLGSGPAEDYQAATLHHKHRIAANNSEKIPVIVDLCKQHRRDQILVMGHYLEMLHVVAKELNCPFLHGGTNLEERERVLREFREGFLPIVVLSRIANMAIDLPSASVAIQVSGLFGSRQEEAQRLGRLLRPGTSSGVFYSLVTEGTVEEKMAQHRQTYLVEQGYAYDVVFAIDIGEERRVCDETDRMREHG